MTLETERLLLKAITRDYIDAIFRAFTAKIAQHMTSRPATYRTETEAFIITAMQENEQQTGLTLAILDRQTADFLGVVSLRVLNSPQPELGIWLKKEAHGQGLGREAVRALKNWADARLTYDYLRYPVDYRNKASRRIAESLNGRIGREFTTHNGSGMPLHILEYWIK